MRESYFCDLFDGHRSHLQVIKQGEDGDFFYVVEEGHFEIFVSRNEQPEKKVRRRAYNEVLLLSCWKRNRWADIEYVHATSRILDKRVTRQSSNCVRIFLFTGSYSLCCMLAHFEVCTCPVWPRNLLTTT